MSPYTCDDGICRCGHCACDHTPDGNVQPNCLECDCSGFQPCDIALREQGEDDGVEYGDPRDALRDRRDR